MSIIIPKGDLSMSSRIRIGICDDDIKTCEILNETIISYEKLMQLQIDVMIFYSGETLLKELMQGEYFDVLFLDIRLESLDGLSVSLKIRWEMQHNFTHIFFITAYKQDTRDILRARPIGLITKPFKKKDIYKALVMSNELTETMEKEKCFEYRVQSTYYKVPIKEIYYFQKYKGKVIIITKRGKQEFYATIENVYQELKDFDFICPDRSFLVNFAYVESFNGQSLNIYGMPDVLPVARSRFAALEAMWKKHRLLKYNKNKNLFKSNDNKHNKGGEN